MLDAMNKYDIKTTSCKFFSENKLHTIFHKIKKNNDYSLELHIKEKLENSQISKDKNRKDWQASISIELQAGCIWLDLIYEKQKPDNCILYIKHNYINIKIKEIEKDIRCLSTYQENILNSVMTTQILPVKCCRCGMDQDMLCSISNDAFMIEVVKSDSQKAYICNSCI